MYPLNPLSFLRQDMKNFTKSKQIFCPIEIDAPLDDVLLLEICKFGVPSTLNRLSQPSK